LSAPLESEETLQPILDAPGDVDAEALLSVSWRAP
jgi:hypothetical protein